MALLPLLICCILATLIKADDFYWYKNAVIYQVYVRSFQDTNGDGIGDLKGVIQHADYLQSLGIEAIWLSSIYPSPNYDFGYDIIDMENINPEYGTLEDFNELVKEMNARGIRVIMDFIPNHTSTKHEWFTASEAMNDTDELYSKFYVWMRPRGYDFEGVPYLPNNWISAMETGTSWEWSEKRRQFYLHTFLVEQADLNYDHPPVRKKMNDVLRLWMSRGVSGFRMGAVSWLHEFLECPHEPPADNPVQLGIVDYGQLNHTCTMDLPETYDIVKEFRKTIDTFQESSKKKEAMLMMTESYSPFDAVVKYYGDSNVSGSTFPLNFFLITNVTKDSKPSEWAKQINNWLNLMDEDKWPNWVLGNHDQNRPASRFGDEWVDLLHMMVMTLPGTIITYNGDEIGLEDTYLSFEEARDLKGIRAGPSWFTRMSRDFQRGPMPWNDTRNGGFSTGKPWLPIAPSFWARNVKHEQKIICSHLNIYKSLTQLRKTQTLTDGSCQVQASDDGLIIITRALEDKPTMLTVLNIADFALTADLTKYSSSLPSTLRIVVRSCNFLGGDSVDTSSVYLPAKSGAVFATSNNYS